MKARQTVDHRSRPRFARSERTARPGHGALYDARVTLQLTQSDLATALGLSLATVQRCERAGSLPQSVASRNLLNRLLTTKKAKIDAVSKKTSELA
jgi:predicted transcriptional regulator